MIVISNQKHIFFFFLFHFPVLYFENVYMKNTVALYDLIPKVFEMKPFNTQHMTVLSVLEYFVASIKHSI